MYRVDGNDTVVELDAFPPICPGAPDPVVLAGDSNVVLSYRSEPAATKIAFIKFSGCRLHLFGAPNDETLTSHPLHSRGLGYYGAYEVRHSSLILEMAARNRVHSRLNPQIYALLKHFVFTFHDNVFECVAVGGQTQLVLSNEPESAARLWVLIAKMLLE